MSTIAKVQSLWRYGTRVGQVINGDAHAKCMRRCGEAYKTCTKYPPAFGIDLLVDDCGGVLEESRRYNFEMLQVRPDDPDWVRLIRERLLVRLGV